MTVRVAMWSGPRNISTAMMRAWENRPDCVVSDEPLYAAYLATTGLDHPGRDEVIAAGDTDWRSVVDGLLEIKARSAMRGGKSKRAIAQTLAQKGIAKDDVAAAIEEADDLYAAVVLARKRAFGPFRKAALDEKRSAKELSAFARGGFSSEIGRRVFAMSLEEAEEILIAGRLL